MGPCTKSRYERDALGGQRGRGGDEVVDVDVGRFFEDAFRELRAEELAACRLRRRLREVRIGQPALQQSSRTLPTSPSAPSTS
jgi:hypothetical protein